MLGMTGKVGGSCRMKKVKLERCGRRRKCVCWEFTGLDFGAERPCQRKALLLSSRGSEGSGKVIIWCGAGRYAERGYSGSGRGVVKSVKI